MRHRIYNVTIYTKIVFINPRVAVYMLAMPILLLSAHPQDLQAKSVQDISYSPLERGIAHTYQLLRCLLQCSFMSNVGLYKFIHNNKKNYTTKFYNIKSSKHVHELNY